MVEVKIEPIDVEPDWKDDGLRSPSNHSEETPPSNTVWIKTEHEDTEVTPLPYYSDVTDIVQTELSSHPCSECGRGFGSQRALKVHLAMCRDPNTYKCQICNRVFSSRCHLDRHQKFRCQVGDAGSLTCPHCHKIFTRTCLLKSHLRRHDNERPFQCDLCEMWFKHKTSLERHKMLHADNKPFACHYCGKRFTTRTLMNPHLRTHTKERPYQCPICLKKFAHKHNMQRHTFQHNKIKHLVCEVCHKVFPRESRLKYHMRVHWEDNKPFKCTRCAKTYSHKQNILRHFQKKHPDVEYIAPDTDAGLATKAWDRTVRYKGGSGDSIVPDQIGDGRDVVHVLPPEVVLVDGGDLLGETVETCQTERCQGETVSEGCQGETVLDRCQDETVPERCQGETVLDRCQDETVPERCQGETVTERCLAQKVPQESDKVPKLVKSIVNDKVSSETVTKSKGTIAKVNKSKSKKCPKYVEILPQNGNNTQESLVKMPKSKGHSIELVPESEYLVGEVPKYEECEEMLLNKKGSQIVDEKLPKYETTLVENVTQVGAPLGSIIGI